MSADNYQLLIRKLDEFIRKFYVNQLIRGAIYTGAILLAAFLVIAVAEYFLYFSTAIRTVLFFSFIAGALFVLVRYVVIPAAHYFRLGKIITHERAAQIIGSHFTDVQDRLLNVLQLKKMADDSGDASLIEASINQKISTLKPVPFTSAINLSLNRKHLRYLIAPLLVLAFILFASPDLLKDSTLRLIHHDAYFERKAPFQFTVINHPLQTIQYTDFRIDVKVSGQSLPADASIEINGFQYPLSKISATEFTYTIIKPQKDIPFFITANGFRSSNYLLKVLQKPIVNKFSTALTYPSYTGRKNETLQNIGDLTVPEGTRINWKFISENISSMTIRFGDSLFNAVPESGDAFSFERRAMHDLSYTLFISGHELPNADSIGYSIAVIPDRYPAISMTALTDSTGNASTPLQKKYVYFTGEASDDYGLRNVYFKYQIQKEGSDNGTPHVVAVPVPFTAGKYSQLSYYWDLSTLNPEPGDHITYYFEAWDNDGVNGSKYTRTQEMSFTKPSAAAMEKQTDEQNEKIKNDLEGAMQEAAQLKNEYEKMQNDLLNKKNPTWEDKKKIQDLLDRQHELNNKIEQIKQSYKENAQNESEYKQFDQQTMTKADELQKLMDETLTPEMKDMMQKLQDLLDQLNKDKTLDQLQSQKLNNEQLQKELDRMLSLFKQLQFEKKLNDAKDKLDELTKKQNDLADKTGDADKNQTGNKEDRQARQDSLSKEQSKLQDQLKEIEKDLGKIDSLNSDLDHPNSLPDLKQEQQQAAQEQQNAQQNLQKNHNSKASQNQKNAAQQMQKMSDQIQQSMQSMQQQQNEMDMRAVRQILENLIKISFDQEDLIGKTKGVNIYNPQYLDIQRKQKDLNDDLQMVEDSIQELSKRVFQIKSFVDQQVADIKKHQEQALQSLEQRQTGPAASHQQYIMTAVNNLALMFNEVMQQMQQQMSQQMSGSQMCQKPGGKKPNLSQMQQQLNDQIQQLSQQMKDGKIPMDKQGGKQMSQQLAQMAQQQAQIREALREMNEQLNKDGKNTMGNLDQLQKEMEKTETELLNKQLTGEMKKRQQDIMTRLLEAENAERQRQQDNQRISNTGKDIAKKLPPEIEAYLRKKQAELELYKTVPPDLKPFYRDLVEEYYKTLQN